MYVHSPTVVFAASVNLVDPPEYPMASMVYDNVTIGDYTDIKPGMLLCLGTTPGGDELGRQRTTGGDTTIVVRFAYTSRGTKDGELLIVDNAYITIYDDRRLWAKMPFIDIAGEVFKDNGVEVGDYGSEPPPVAVMRPGTAGTAVDGELIVSHVGQDSFAVADGATITDYLWDIGDGTLLAGTLTDDVITVSYPPGFRYASLRVTDSNGKTHTTERPVFVDDPNVRLTTTNFRITGHTIAETGQVMTVELLEDLTRDNYPDGVLVMIWDKEPTSALERDHLLIQGWLHTERGSLSAQETGFLKNDSLTIVDIGGKLNASPGFAQVIYDEVLRDEEFEPETTWQYMTAPNLDKFMVYLLYWHSTVLELVDFYPSGTWEEYPFVELQASGASMFAQSAKLAEMLVPDHRLKVTTLGQLKVLVDQMLIDVEDRSESNIVTLEENEWREVSWDYNRIPRYHTLWGQAILAVTDYEDVGDDEVLTTVRSIAPGTIPGQGLSENTWPEQLAKTQADLNSVTGHRYERVNSRYGPLTIQVPGDIIREEFQLDTGDWVVLHVSAEKAARRGLPSTIIRGLFISANIAHGTQPTGKTYDSSITIEVETSGEPAMTWNPDTGLAEEDDGDWTPPEVTPPPLPPTTPPSDGLIEGQQLVAAIDGRTGANPTLYRTFDFQTPSSSGGPEWEAISLGITDDFLRSFVVDPFSPGYLYGIGAINAWAVGNEAIWRIEDLFGETPIATSIYTYSDQIDGSSVFQSRTIHASFGAFFEDLNDNPWLMVVSHYADASGHTGTWANYSVDAGVTWSGDKLISEHYDTDLSGSEPQVITSVYLSPKTPGLAYACAYLETDSPALATGFISTDWGETWTALGDSENPLEPLPLIGLIRSGGEGSHPYELLATGPTAYVSGSHTENIYNNELRYWFVMISPPEDAVRIVLEVEWTATYIRTSGFTSSSLGLSLEMPSSISDSGDFSYTAPAQNSTTSGSFTQEFTFIGTNWPKSREEVEATPPTNGSGALGLEWTLLSTNPNQTVSFTMSVRVAEIELDGGLIYTPISLGVIQPNHRLGGYLHGPWLDNDDEALWYYGHVTREATLAYRLKRVDAGVDADISPSDAGLSYGQNRTIFGVRTHDSDSSKVLLGGIANDTSASTGDDKHAIFLSEDEGGSWSKIYGPLNDSDFGQTKGFGVAFSGEELDVIFAWGASGGDPGTIIYSDNNGASFDDKAGNLSTLAGGSGPDGFIGIAGGPT